jgi:hypothetical protein
VDILGKDQPKDLIFFCRSGNPIEDDDTVLIAGVDGNADVDEDDDDQHITNKLANIAEQEETDHVIREVDGKIMELQLIGPELQQFDGVVENAVPVTTEPPQVQFTESEQPPAPVNPTGVRRLDRILTCTVGSVQLNASRIA